MMHQPRRVFAFPNLKALSEHLTLADRPLFSPLLKLSRTPLRFPSGSASFLTCTMSSVAAAADAIELEAKRKDDSSWHPCQVSLSSDTSSSFGLIVDFGSKDHEEVISTKEEALARLRIRSVPLQGDECFHIKDGEHVLASQNTEFSLFFDAKVEKVCRVRHSKRNQCRCTFEIKWLYLHLGKGTVTVPSSSVRRLATNTVDSHPLVGEFLDSVKTFNCSGVSSIVSLLEEAVFEDLEKQIEEISRLADVSRKGADDCPLEVKKDLTRQVRHRTIASQVSNLHDPVPHEQNNSRRTTRSQRKIQPETEKVPPPPQSVIQQPDRTHLSPLGARAALASLMYKLPPEPEVSTYNEERKGFINAVQSTSANYTSKISLDVTKTFVDSDIQVHEMLSMEDDLLWNIEARPTPVVLTDTKVLTSGKRDASKRLSRKPASMPNDTEDLGSNTVTVKRSLRSKSDGKVESPITTTRLTRSAIQKHSGLSNYETELKSSSEEMICSPTHKPRFTRSTMQKEKGNAIMEVNKGLQESKLAEETTPKLIHRTNQKKLGHSNDHIEVKISFEETSLHNRNQTPRFTRSVKQKEAGTVAVEVNKGLEESKLSQETCSDFKREEHLTPWTKETRRKKPFSCPSNEEINLSVPQESKKKQKVANDTRITRSGGEISEAGGSLQGEKQSVLLKTTQMLRSSPRLRSQKKSAEAY